MADLNLLQDKRILAAFAAAQKIPGLRGVFKLVAKMVLRGRIKTINDLAENPEFQRIARKLTRTEVNIYTKVLTPIGFPQLAIRGAKVEGFISRRAARAGVQSGLHLEDASINIKRIKKILFNIKKKSIQKKIDSSITNKIWKNMISAYINYQRKNFKK